MPIVVSWIGPDRTHRQQPVSSDDKARKLKEYLDKKGTKAEIIKVSHAPKW